MSLELINVTSASARTRTSTRRALRLEPGSFNMLLGTTLAGKTTLMQLMAGLQQPTAGADPRSAARM